MTFENLVFIDHPIGGGIMAKIRMGNGKVLSVVAGSSFYSTPQAPLFTPEEFISFEVLVEGEDDVRGWQSREDINQIIKANE